MSLNLIINQSTGAKWGRQFEAARRCNYYHIQTDQGKKDDLIRLWRCSTITVVSWREPRRRRLFRKSTRRSQALADGSPAPLRAHSALRRRSAAGGGPRRQLQGSVQSSVARRRLDLDLPSAVPHAFDVEFDPFSGIVVDDFDIPSLADAFDQFELTPVADVFDDFDVPSIAATLNDFIFQPSDAVVFDDFALV